jgi:hypothetical protein
MGNGHRSLSLRQRASAHRSAELQHPEYPAIISPPTMYRYNMNYHRAKLESRKERIDRSTIPPPVQKRLPYLLSPQGLDMADPCRHGVIRCSALQGVSLTVTARWIRRGNYYCHRVLRHMSTYINPPISQSNAVVPLYTAFGER